jgi:hypothetical protein
MEPKGRPSFGFFVYLVVPEKVPAGLNWIFFSQFNLYSLPNPAGFGCVINLKLRKKSLNFLLRVRTLPYIFYQDNAIGGPFAV